MGRCEFVPRHNPCGGRDAGPPRLWCRDCLLAELAELQAAVDELKAEASSVRDEAFQQFLASRDIETPCHACSGMGVRTYGSTATWRGGVGGQVMTSGRCNHCWGSGDEDRHWVDLRLVEGWKQAAAMAAKDGGTYGSATHQARMDVKDRADRLDYPKEHGDERS